MSSSAPQGSYPYGGYPMSYGYPQAYGSRALGVPQTETQIVTENVPVQTYQTVVENQVPALSLFFTPSSAPPLSARRMLRPRIQCLNLC